MPRGRPTKLTEELIEKICNGVRLGMTYKRACEAVNITERTFHSWMAKGRDEKKQYVHFFQSIKRAEAECTEMCLAVIRRAAVEGTWTAAAWLLERRYPKEYGRISREPTDNALADLPVVRDEQNRVEMMNKIRGIYGLPPIKDESGGNGTTTGN